MLSPKLLRKDAGSLPHPLLDNFKCLVNKPAVQQLPKLELLKEHMEWSQDVEHLNYVPVAAFLNKCVEECDSAYNTIHNNLAQDSYFKVAA